MAKKQKYIQNNNSNKHGFTSITYKHFNSSSSNGSRRRNQKNRKKYFEHDTRTRTTTTTTTKRTLVSPVHKIKLNNEINIFETKKGYSDNDPQIQSELIYPKPKLLKNKRKIINNANSFNNRNRKRQVTAISKTNIQSTTKKLQKQLIETQKKLQKQLIELQKHQREQSNSFLALIRSNCVHTLDKTIAQTVTTDSKLNHDTNAANANPCQSISDFNKPNSNLTHLHSNNNCSENFCKHFTDQNKCPNDKMAKGNKTMTIRPFTCDGKSKNCPFGIEVNKKPATPPKTIIEHQCSSCVDQPSNLMNVRTNNDIKAKSIKIKRPLIKSIILSTAQSNPILATPEKVTIKKEIDDKQSNTYEILNKNDNSNRLQEIKVELKEMQFMESKKSKQVRPPYQPQERHERSDEEMESGRSYSPPLPKSMRLTSVVSNESAKYTGNDKVKRSSRERRSRKKKRKRRQKSYSRSRSSSRHTRSRSYSRSRSKSRSKSYRRSSRSSTRSDSIRRYSKDRKKSANSKHRDVFHTLKKDERNCGCNCNCTNYCKKSAEKRSKDSNNKRHSKSPSFNETKTNYNSINTQNAINLKQNISTANDSLHKKEKNDTKSNGSGQNSQNAKKKMSLTLNSGVLLKPQPIVKLQSSPGTASDSDNDEDDRFDKKYEELLTFETNEDERHEQRLLKALSGIAAKAKQKLQTVTDPTNTNKKNSADPNHDDRSTSKSLKTHHDSARKQKDNSIDQRTERHTPEHRYDDDDYSPRGRNSSRRSSRRDSSSSKGYKSPRSSRSPSIPRRRGSPSFLDRRRITSARKKPIPYQRSSPYDSYDEWDSS